NTANGAEALFSNTEGVQNTANGFGALSSNTTGSNNTANGYNVLLSNTTGNANTAYGLAANLFNEEGSNNTIIGFQAGRGTSLHNKSGNVFLGYQAGYNDTTDNKLYIENSQSPTPLIYGDFSSNLLRVNGTFDINDAYQFPTTDGTSGQVLQTDGSGELNWVTYAGGSVNEINDLSDGKTGGNSVFLGSGAGADDDGTDNQNVAVGIEALTANTSGYRNTATGYQALDSDTTGYGNTANGYRALTGNTTGNYNTAIGYLALMANKTGNYNTAIGRNANYANQQGSNNTIIGYEAGGRSDFYHNKSGNVFLGYQAGYKTNFGSDANVFLGYQAGYNETGANKLYIENSDTIAPLIYGEFDNDILAFNANVGIGTTAPEAGLHVDDTDGVLFTGEFGTGDIPIEGPGTRMMWYPAKAALRVGRVTNENWDNANIGDYSVAMGFNTKATGSGSTAMGNNAKATGDYSTAMGYITYATGHYSTAMGNITNATGTVSTAMGYNATATGDYSTAMGYYTDAESSESVVMGRFNVGGGNPTSWVETDPLFEIGRGTSTSNPINALTVLKNGNVGIGIATPASRLDVQGNVTIRDINTGDIAIELGKGLDYAEGFNVTDKINIEPGAILCIDPENPGKLKISETAYDKTVAGIVAGANGLGSGVRLGTQEFDCDVALAGRVYCNTIATTENIEPGDMLTTSSIPGFAMKVTDFENAHGAILGKAMESLEKGKKGQILVLVTLH
ncbi:MAG: hypothetical protein K8R86_00870, partial [Bacteroidales bacterium]|nr:hypothetical protein [Bacteroidales bacterium]